MISSKRHDPQIKSKRRPQTIIKRKFNYSFAIDINFQYQSFLAFIHFQSTTAFVTSVCRSQTHFASVYCVYCCFVIQHLPSTLLNFPPSDLNNNTWPLFVVILSLVIWFSSVLYLVVSSCAAVSVLFSIHSFYFFPLFSILLWSLVFNHSVCFLNSQLFFKNSEKER